MRKLITLLSIVLLMGCSKDEITNNHYYVDTVEVQFSTSKVLTTSSEGFTQRNNEKMASTNSTSNFDSSYEHPLPEVFTAYFVANETKGQYTEGDVVLELDVVEGQNTITVPQLELHVYVTNYAVATLPEDWYTWNDAIEQLPQTSTELFMLGDNVINYKETLEGEVSVLNPYAAVMIMDNQWVSGVPSSYDTSQEYVLVGDNVWYNLYIRNDNTNSQIPISIPGNYDQQYDLNRDIEANRIYQYVINGDVLEDDGNLNVIVSSLEEGYREEIQL